MRTLLKTLPLILFIFAGCSSFQYPYPKVWINYPHNKEVMRSPFTVQFGAQGVKVMPSGEVVANAGHHHILINHDPIPEGETIPADETHLHYGGGQTQSEIKLKPGKYKITLQFGNGLHESYGPDLSDTIEITVK